MREKKNRSNGSTDPDWRPSLRCWEAAHLLSLSLKSTVVPSVPREPAAAGPMPWVTRGTVYYRGLLYISLPGVWVQKRLVVRSAPPRATSEVIQPCMAWALLALDSGTQCQESFGKVTDLNRLYLQTEGFTAGARVSLSFWVRDPEALDRGRPWNILSDWCLLSIKPWFHSRHLRMPFLFWGITKII